MLDHEVRIYEIERRILEGEAGAKVGDDEMIERHVLGAGLGVEVNTDKLGDLVSVSGQACCSPTPCVQCAGGGREGKGKEPGLDLGVRRLEGHSPT